MSLRSTGGGFKNPRNSGATVDTLQMNKDKTKTIATVRQQNQNNGNIASSQERLTMPTQLKNKTKKIEEKMNEETIENSREHHETSKERLRSSKPGTGEDTHKTEIMGKEDN